MAKKAKTTPVVSERWFVIRIDGEVFYQMQDDAQKIGEPSRRTYKASDFSDYCERHDWARSFSVSAELGDYVTLTKKDPRYLTLF